MHSPQVDLIVKMYQFFLAKQFEHFQGFEGIFKTIYRLLSLIDIYIFMYINYTELKLIHEDASYAIIIY